MPTGVGRGRPGPGGGLGRRIGDPGLRPARDRQVDPALPGAGVGGRRRARGAAGLGRGVAGPGAAAAPRGSARCPRACSALAGPDVVAIEAAIERHHPALVVVDSVQTVCDAELPGPAGQPGPGPSLRGPADPAGQVERRCPSSWSATSPRTAIWPGHGRSSTSWTPCLSFDGRPASFPARPDCGQAPVRARPARWASSKCATTGCGPCPTPAHAARGPHGRCPGQRRRPRAAGPAAAAGGGAGAARPGRGGPRPRTLGIDAGAGHPAAGRARPPHRGRGRRRPRSSWPPWAASASPSRRWTWAWRSPWHRRSTGRVVPADLVVFGELGLAGEVRMVPGADRRLAEAWRAGFTRALVPASTSEGGHRRDRVPAPGAWWCRVRTLGRGGTGRSEVTRRTMAGTIPEWSRPWSQPLNDALALVAPGTALREGLDRILQAKRGALIVVGDDPAVLSVCTGGFLLDAEFSPQRLSELAKMDGAIILAADASRIARANVHLVPEGQHPHHRDRHPAPDGRAGGPVHRRAGDRRVRGHGHHRRLPQRPETHQPVVGLVDRPLQPGPGHPATLPGALRRGR